MAERVDTKDTIKRRAGAMTIVNRYVIYSAGAGLVTIPIVDVATLGAIHVALIKEITEYFDAEFSEHAARNIVIAIGAGLIPGSIGSAIGRKVLRALPFMTPGLGLATMAAFSAAVSYGLGLLFIRHFEAGGTLDSFNVDDLHRVFQWKRA